MAKMLVDVGRVVLVDAPLERGERSLAPLFAVLRVGRELEAEVDDRPAADALHRREDLRELLVLELLELLASCCGVDLLSRALVGVLHERASPCRSTPASRSASRARRAAPKRLFGRRGRPGRRRGRQMRSIFVDSRDESGQPLDRARAEEAHHLLDAVRWAAFSRRSSKSVCAHSVSAAVGRSCSSRPHEGRLVLTASRTPASLKGRSDPGSIVPSAFFDGGGASITLTSSGVMPMTILLARVLVELGQRVHERSMPMRLPARGCIRMSDMAASVRSGVDVLVVLSTATSFSGPVRCLPTGARRSR